MQFQFTSRPGVQAGKHESTKLKISSSTEAWRVTQFRSLLPAIIESLRFPYHTSYIIVVLGATIFGPPLSLQLAASLLVHYVLFYVCLYGGIYTMNGILDADIDAQRATKRHRPIPSGRMSKAAAWLLVATLWLTAFAGVYAWDRSTFFWHQYAAFVPVNLAYGMWVRRTDWRFTVALTAPLKLRLGVLIAMRCSGEPVAAPVAAYVAAFFVVACVQVLTSICWWLNSKACITDRI
jgi:4-hydroxybenzoate polyprenyltransferase